MNDSKIAVSVIIPVYDTEEYFDRCIRSIMSQTLQEIEIIVVNDCSPGDIEQRIKPYMEEDSRIQYMKTESNKKTGGARNLGKKQAKGEFIMFCDSDDWLDYSTLEAMYGITTGGTNEIDVVNCGLYRDYNDNTSRWDHQYSKNFSVSGRTALKVLAHQLDYGYSISVSPANKIYRKELIADINFIENLYYEEPYFNYRALKNARKVGFVSEGKYTYFCRQGSVIQSITGNHIKDIEQVFNKIKQDIVSSKEYDEYRDTFISFLDFYFNIIVEQIYDQSDNEKDRQRLLLEIMHVFDRLVSIDEYLRYLGCQRFRWKIQGDMLASGRRLL